MLVADKILHLHPSNACNFHCMHCYSSSSPSGNNTLNFDQILSVTPKLHMMGYTHVSISGGEPTILPWITKLINALYEQGFDVSLISNGWKINRLLMLAETGKISSIGLSIDGAPQQHDNVRLKRGSYARVLEAITVLNNYGMSVAAVVSITGNSFRSLPEIVADLVNSGCNRIQLHPIAEVGRAKRNSSELFNELDEEQLVRLILMTNILRKRWPKVTIACDALFTKNLPKTPLNITGDIISPLVIDEQGNIIPIVYGLNKRFHLGNIKDEIDIPLYSIALQTLIESCLSKASKEIATSFYQQLVAFSNNVKK